MAELLNKKAKGIDKDDTKNERELTKGEIKSRDKTADKIMDKSKLKNPLLVGLKTKVWIQKMLYMLLLQTWQRKRNKMQA